MPGWAFAVLVAAMAIKAIAVSSDSPVFFNVFMTC